MRVAVVARRVGAQASELEGIADAIVPNLPETPDHLALNAEYRRFKAAG